MLKSKVAPSEQLSLVIAPHRGRQSGCPTLKSPDAAFLGFCKARYARRH